MTDGEVGVKFSIALFVAVAAAGAARADMSGLVGNTVIGSTPDGLTRKIMLRADGSYRITVSDGSYSAGTWKADGAKLCYLRVEPKPDPNPFCVEGLDGHKAGDSWKTVGHNNVPVTMTVVQGQ
jgi:hypothetical protein